MEKIAVFSDVHGNLQALEVANEEIQAWSPDRVWFLGDAVVFSCSLLHQATPVTSGRRFVLLSFFFGDDAQEMRERQASALAAKGG